MTKFFIALFFAVFYLIGCTGSSSIQSTYPRLKIMYFTGDSVDGALELHSIDTMRINGANIVYPSVIEKVIPEYHPIGIRAKAQGIVNMLAWVDSTGSPRKVMVLKTEADLFNHNSVTAVINWKFSPLLVENKKTPFVAIVPIGYRFTGRKPEVVLPDSLNAP